MQPRASSRRAAVRPRAAGAEHDGGVDDQRAQLRLEHDRTLAAEFAVAPERWTRFWAFSDPHPDGEWHRFSLWVADEARAAVMVCDGLQIQPRTRNPLGISMDGSWDILRLEYNTSTSGGPEGRGPLVGYVRNVVMLRGVSAAAVTGLLARPGTTGGTSGGP